MGPRGGWITDGFGRGGRVSARVPLLLALCILLFGTIQASAGPLRFETVQGSATLPLQGITIIDLASPLNYAVVPPGTPVQISIVSDGFTSATFSLDQQAPETLAFPYTVDTSAWFGGTHLLRIDVFQGSTVEASRTFVLFIDPQAAWPLDTTHVDVVLIGFDVPPADLQGLLLSPYQVETAVRREPEVRQSFDLQFTFDVRSANESYHRALLEYVAARAVHRDSLQARLNLTALVHQRNTGVPMDIFDPLVGWEVRSEEVEWYLQQFPPVPPLPGGRFTFYVMNLSAMDDASRGIDHWFQRDTPDPDTGRDQDWWRLEWDNDLNTPMGYPMNIFGGPGHRVYIDPTAYQWYLDWTYVWWLGGDGPATYGLQYEAVPPEARAPYLAQQVNDLVRGLAATLPWGPPEEPAVRIRNYVLSGSTLHTGEGLAWVVSEGRLADYLSQFLPSKAWGINTTFAAVDEYPSLKAVVDSNTTFAGDRGYINGSAVWDYLLQQRGLYVPDDPGAFEILTVNFLYDNRSMTFAGREFTGLGGLGVTTIFLRTDRLFYADGTRQKGLTSIISHEAGHSLGYGHQFGPRYSADFVEGNMGYFRSELGYGTFWEDAYYRVVLRARLLALLDQLANREPLNLAPEFVGFYRHYHHLDFRRAEADLDHLEAMLEDVLPPSSNAGPDFVVAEGQKAILDGGSSTDNFRVLRYGWDFGDGTSLHSSSPVVEKVWAQPGTYIVSLTVFDAGGNTDSDTARVTVLDATPPDLAITSPSSGAYLPTANVTVAWVSRDAASGLAGVQVGLDGATPVPLDPEASSYDFTGLAEGYHTVTVTAFDNAGNHRSASVAFTVDISPPVVTISRPERPPAAGQILLWGTFREDNPGDITLHIYDRWGNLVQTADASLDLTDGTWTARVTLPRGHFVVVAVARDLAGSEGTATLRLLVRPAH